MRKIYYLVHYVENDSEEKRYFSLAAKRKIDYLLYVLNELNMKVELISASNTISKKSYGFTSKQINKNFTIVKLPCIGRGNKFRNFLSTIVFKIIRIIYLLLRIKKNDLLLIYHSVDLINVGRILKKVKKVKIIIDVEEIYGDVYNSPYTKNKELKYFRIADGYLFSTKKLNEMINLNNKPYLVYYGDYRLQPIYKKNDDGIVKCVYAGTLEERKGAMNALLCVKYLPKNYSIRLIGFGTKKEIEKILTVVQELKSKGYDVEYDGCLLGESCDDYIRGCDIGLCTQDSESLFNATSFPSKIVNYISLGLNVVAPNLEVINKSPFSSIITTYNGNEHKNIANAIIDAKSKINNSNELFDILNKEFIDSAEKLINDELFTK